MGDSWREFGTPTRRIRDAWETFATDAVTADLLLERKPASGVEVYLEALRDLLRVIEAEQTRLLVHGDDLDVSKRALARAADLAPLTVQRRIDTARAESES